MNKIIPSITPIMMNFFDLFVGFVVLLGRICFLDVKVCFVFFAFVVEKEYASVELSISSLDPSVTLSDSPSVSSAESGP